MSIDQHDYNTCEQALSSKVDVGIDVRDDSALLEHFRIAKDARAEARGIERLYWRHEGSDTSRASWEVVAKEAQALLNDHTCDMELYAWLCEAWLRLDGYHGLANGFTLLQKALEQFGETLYPVLDDGEDREWKVIALTGLNGEEAEGSLIAPLTNVPLSADGRFCLWHYRRAIALEQISDEQERERQLAQGVVAIDEIKQAIQETGKAAIAYQLRTIEEALERFEALESVLTQVFGHDAPPTRRIRDTLSECIEQCRYLMIAVFGDDVCLTEAIDIVGAVEQAAGPISNGPIADRQQALQTLLSVGHYFKQHEPQSPIPYMLERVVSWADLAWPDLIARLVQNPNEMEHIFNLTGIHRQEEVVSEA